METEDNSSEKRILDQQIQQLMQKLQFSENTPIWDLTSKLAELHELEYEQCRKIVAKYLNIRETVLDRYVTDSRKSAERALIGFESIEPWNDEVDGSDLLNEISSTLKRFIICDEHYIRAMSLWVVFTWVIEHMQIAPILMITAPEKRCGKTLTLDVLGKLVNRTLIASSVTSSAIYRVIEQENPTLCIDEADTFLKGNESLRGIINSGHTRTAAFTMLTNPNTLQVERYSTWCAKIISGIGTHSDTIMDRSIVIRLRRKFKNETIERLSRTDPKIFMSVKRKIKRWIEDNHTVLSLAKPDTLLELNDRAADNWEPLFAIADTAGNEWSMIARDIALKISLENEVQSTSTELLSDIRDVFANKNVTRIKTYDLLQALFEDEDKPWKSWNRGNEMTANQLSKKLSDFSISPKNFRDQNVVFKGYSLDMFKEAFERYLDRKPENADVESPDDLLIYSDAGAKILDFNKRKEAMERLPKHAQDEDSESLGKNPDHQDDPDQGSQENSQE